MDVFSRLQIQSKIKSMTRPEVSFDELMIGTQENPVWIAGKHHWSPIIVIPEDRDAFIAEVSNTPQHNELVYIEPTGYKWVVHGVQYYPIENILQSFKSEAVVLYFENAILVSTTENSNVY